MHFSFCAFFFVFRFFWCVCVLTTVCGCKYYIIAQHGSQVIEQICCFVFDACVPCTGTALHYACNYDRGDTAAVLIDHGASLSEKSAELQLVAIHLGERKGESMAGIRLYVASQALSTVLLSSR